MAGSANEAEICCSACETSTAQVGSSLGQGDPAGDTNAVIWATIAHRPASATEASLSAGIEQAVTIAAIRTVKVLRVLTKTETSGLGQRYGQDRCPGSGRPRARGESCSDRYPNGPAATLHSDASSGVHPVVLPAGPVGKYHQDIEVAFEVFPATPRAWSSARSLKRATVFGFLRHY